MNLEVDMYVRNHLGRIEKIKSIESYNEKYCINGHEFSNNVIKASHNIIDLIEKYDVVVDRVGNKYEVIDKVSNLKLIVNHLVLDTSIGKYFNKQLFKDDIVKVLTHEQFENNCYKIGDELK